MTPESVMCSKLTGILNMIHSFLITRMLRLAEFGALEAKTLLEYLENVSLYLVNENICIILILFVLLYFWFCDGFCVCVSVCVCLWESEHLFCSRNFVYNILNYLVSYYFFF